MKLGGGRAFLKNPHEGDKRPSLPSPNPTPKTFVFIESLLSAFPVYGMQAGGIRLQTLRGKGDRENA